jgi:hypothetical protein
MAITAQNFNICLLYFNFDFLVSLLLFSYANYYIRNKQYTHMAHGDSYLLFIIIMNIGSLTNKIENSTIYSIFLK